MVYGIYIDIGANLGEGGAQFGVETKNVQLPEELMGFFECNGFVLWPA